MTVAAREQVVADLVEGLGSHAADPSDTVRVE